MESFLATLKEQVKCSLCSETLKEPKLLPCFHVFCTSCIEGHLKLNDEEQNIFQCFECDSESLLQDPNDIIDLQISPVHSRILKVLEFIESQKICSVSSSHSEALWQCVECNQSLCDECLHCHSKFTKNHQVVSLSDLKEEDIKVLLRKEPPCKVHDNCIVESHCLDCDTLLCVLCMKSHQNHKTATLQEFMAAENELSKILEDIDIICDDEEEKNRQEEKALKIKSETEKAEQQVKEMTEKLMKTLKYNEQHLLDKIHKSRTKAERNLRVIRHTKQAQEYIKYFKDNGTASEMINTLRGESSQNFTYDPFDQSDPRVEFTFNEKLCEQVECGLGQVRTYLKKADPKKCSVRVEPCEIEALQQAQLVVNLKTSKGEDTDELLDNIKTIFTPSSGVNEGEMQMADNSETTLDFTPRVPGPLSVNITLHGNSISNCPLMVVVKPQLMEELTEDSELKKALINTGSKKFQGIAVNKNNTKIAVADWESNCVTVFEVASFGITEGRCWTMLKRPRGLAFVSDTELVIVDSGHNRICIIDTRTNSLTRTFGNTSSGNGQFQNPEGVHVDEESNIIVCDRGNNRVQIFTKDGDFLGQFSVQKPHSVVKHNQRFYVSEMICFSVVQVIEMKDGQSRTVAVIDVKSCNTDSLLWPSGLAIDNENNLLVCSRYSIFKFTLNGQYVGRSSRLAKSPRYIAVLKDGQIIYTTDKAVLFLKSI